MKKKKTWLYILGIAIVGALLYYFVFMSTSVPEEYGPVEFQITMKPDPDAEAYGYDAAFMEGRVEVEFSPEGTGIKRDDINSLKLKNLVLTTDHKDGFKPFDHITITINSDETETVDVGTIPIKDGDIDSLVITGRDAAEVPDFKNIKKFRVMATLNFKAGSTVNKPVKLNGKMMLNVMVEEDSDSDTKSKAKEEDK